MSSGEMSKIKKSLLIAVTENKADKVETMDIFYPCQLENIQIKHQCLSLTSIYSSSNICL